MLFSQRNTSTFSFAASIFHAHIGHTAQNPVLSLPEYANIKAQSGLFPHYANQTANN